MAVLLSLVAAAPAVASVPPGFQETVALSSLPQAASNHSYRLDVSDHISLKPPDAAL